MKKQREVSYKRGPLTKPAPMAGRRAEIPIKGPQYEMQHREMEQQAYGGFSNNGFNGGSTPPPQQPQVRRSPDRAPPPLQGAPRLVQPAELQSSDQFYYSPDMTQQMIYPQQRLPPGAMPPMDQQSSWSAPNSPIQHTSSASPQRRSRSPPNFNQYGGNNMMAGGGRAPGRSLSATAVPSPSSPNINGKLRKGTSAHAVATKGSPRTPESHQNQVYQANGAAEEEDMPLAVWQQQRRR